MASEINVIHEENGVRFKTEFFHEELYTPSINNLHGNVSSPKKAVGTKKKILINVHLLMPLMINLYQALK